MKMAKRMIVLFALVAMATAGIVSIATAAEVDGAAYIQVQPGVNL